MKKIIMAVLLSFVTFGTCSAQVTYFVNPGLRIGYAFGERGGFTYGGELSVVRVDWSKEEGGRYGITLDYNNIQGIETIHLGGEYLYRFTGIDIGPTIGWVDQKPVAGMSVIPFGGLFALVYYDYTYLWPTHQYHEMGIYGKVPFGRVILNFGD